MELGSSLQLFALEVDLLQGVVNYLFERLPDFRTIEDPDGAYRLELEPPRLETREGDFRLGIAFSGQVFLGTAPDASLFLAWVRLRPVVGTNEAGEPVGMLAFDAIEEFAPASAQDALNKALGADGPFSAALAAMKLDIFPALTYSVHEQLTAPETPFDPTAFALAFYLGRPAAIARPVWRIRREGDAYVPDLDLDVSYLTRPALVASVAFAGEDAVPPGAPSIVRPGTGLALVSTARLFDARFELESAAIRGQVLNGLTMDRLEVVSTDYGFDVNGEGHKTGASVSFSGALVAQWRGGVGGQLLLRSTVQTDVDTAWWVDVLSVVAAVVPGLGWFLGDAFIWGPEAEAPGKVESALLDKFLTPLQGAAQRLASEFAIAILPTEAFVADVWFFDGHMGVAAVAFAGTQTAGVQAVMRDTAHVVRAPGGAGRHDNRRRPVESVEEIVLTTGQALKPWQAGKLVADGLLRIPGHHAVANPLARGGVYLRSNPDDTRSNNLLS